MNEILGWLTEREMDILKSWVNLLPKNSIIIEVGSMQGKSAAALSFDKNNTVYCYDRWDGFPEPDNITISKEKRKLYNFPYVGMKNTYEGFLKNTSHIKNIKSKKIKDRSDINWTNGKTVDLLFIDAAHENPSDWEYITYLLPFIKNCGYICGHDMNKYFPDILENISKLEIMFNTKVKTFTDSSLWQIQTNDIGDII